MRLAKVIRKFGRQRFEQANVFVQELTDEYAKKIDALLKAKEEEILEV